MTQTLLFLLVIGIGLFYAVKYGNRAKKDIVEFQQINKNSDQNQYIELRKRALNMTAEQLGFKIPEDSIKVYGIISDIDMGRGTATVVTYLTGDASIYLSSGGGFIGAGQHENVQRVTKEFVNNGHLTSFKGKPIENFDLPSTGNANFYFLSNMGNTRITENIAKMENGESEFSTLFADLNNVMTEIRLKSEE